MARIRSGRGFAALLLGVATIVFLSGAPAAGAAGWSAPSDTATAKPTAASWQRELTVRLAANHTTVRVGRVVTLTATASTNVGPTPYYIEIFDATTGNRLQACAVGVTCTATIKQATPTTHAFIAYLSYDSTAYPPPGSVATSGTSFVTWSNNGYTITLTGRPLSNNTINLTATANRDVTPYVIQIFREDGTRVTSCGDTTCGPTGYPTTGCTDEGQPQCYFVAFISDNDQYHLPPTNTQASSNIVSIAP